jgi:hypothetical protein
MRFVMAIVDVRLTMVLSARGSPVTVPTLQPMLIARLQSITCCFVRIPRPALPISKD